MDLLNYKDLKEQVHLSGLTSQLDGPLLEGMERATPRLLLSETQVYEGLEVKYEPLFVRDSESGLYTYQGFLASTRKEIRIDHPEPILSGQNRSLLEFGVDGSKIRISTVDLEYILQHGIEDIISKTVWPGKENFASWERHVVEAALYQAMSVNPTVFNLLMAKYQPSITFNIDEKHVAAQRAIFQRHTPFHFFKAGYGFTTEQAFRMLAHVTWVYKKGNDGNEEGAWLRINFKRMTTMGVYEYLRVEDRRHYDPVRALKSLAFKEFYAEDGGLNVDMIDSICERFRLGEKVEVTPLNPEIESTVFIAADPQYRSIYIFNYNGRKLKRAPFHKDYVPQVKSGVDSGLLITDRGRGQGPVEPIDSNKHSAGVPSADQLDGNGSKNVDRAIRKFNQWLKKAGKNDGKKLR